MPDEEPWRDGFRLSNTSAGDLLLWLEPWAEEFTIPPRAELVLWIRGGGADGLEIEQSEGQIVVYAGAAMRVRVDIDGVAQPSGAAELAVPDIGNLSTRAFIDLAFGSLPDARPGGRSWIPPSRKRGWLRRLFGAGRPDRD